MVVLGSSELPTQWRLEAQSDRWLCPSQRPDPDWIWPSSSERKEDVFRKREKPTDSWVIWLQLGGSILYVIIFWSVKFNKSPFDIVPGTCCGERVNPHGLRGRVYLWRGLSNGQEPRHSWLPLSGPSDACPLQLFYSLPKHSSPLPSATQGC